MGYITQPKYKGLQIATVRQNDGLAHAIANLPGFGGVF